MEFDMRDLQGILSLNDKEFSQKLRQVLISAGASAEVQKMLCANPGQIKGLLASLSPEDIQKLAGRLDDKTLQAVQDSLKRGE